MQINTKENENTNAFQFISYCMNKTFLNICAINCISIYLFSHLFNFDYGIFSAT